ncbi:hypothetical protein EVAR_93359_1 [Eumeta japonica]|uniref:Uncharacterized protein n=1 Tax=Eumeta variegata TaxID=151549 RepID=A0A4C1UU88_EUMVA|nr:hypothetical protein EVAR_93359_1 [Eumeta japonica]
MRFAAARDGVCLFAVAAMRKSIVLTIFLNTNFCASKSRLSIEQISLVLREVRTRDICDRKRRPSGRAAARASLAEIVRNAVPGLCNRADGLGPLPVTAAGPDFVKATAHDCGFEIIDYPSTVQTWPPRSGIAVHATRASGGRPVRNYAARRPPPPARAIRDGRAQTRTAVLIKHIVAELLNSPPGPLAALLIS